jgi:hypothetical protein
MMGEPGRDMGKKPRLTLSALMVLIALVAILCRVAMVTRPRTSEIPKYGYSVIQEGDLVSIVEDTYFPNGNQIYHIVYTIGGERALERAQAWVSKKYNSLPDMLGITSEEVKAYNSKPRRSRVRGGMTYFGP